MMFEKSINPHIKQTKESIKLTKHDNKYLLFFTFCLFLFWGATVLPVSGAVDYLGQMGVLRPNETVDAPNFTLSDLEGRKRSLHEFQGKFDEGRKVNITMPKE